MENNYENNYVFNSFSDLNLVYFITLFIDSCLLNENAVTAKCISHNKSKSNLSKHCSRDKKYLSV